MMRTAVIGAGAWGTALGDLLARNGHDVVIWAHESDVVQTINEQHENVRFLKGASLHARVTATGDMAEALRGARLVTYAAPSHVLRAVVRQQSTAPESGAVLVVATKGIERESLRIMTDVIHEEMPGNSVVALSGPSFAAEVVARQPTAVVAASNDPGASESVQAAFSSKTFRVYTHDDVVGVELGGALKNVMAVATGMAEGLGLGYNSRAALITRGLAEIVRLGTALGANPATFAGLAGVGDLVLTCTGLLSRNRSVGVEIGEGKTLDEVLARKETVAEGVNTTQSAHALAAREGVEMPIVDTVYRILFQGFAVRDAIGSLMTRELRPEQDR